MKNNSTLYRVRVACHKSTMIDKCSIEGELYALKLIFFQSIVTWHDTARNYVIVVAHTRINGLDVDCRVIFVEVIIVNYHVEVDTS